MTILVLGSFGRFNTGVTINLSSVLEGDMDNNYIQTVHASLIHVVLEEIPLGPNWRIFSKLMEKPECSKIANDLANAGGYICQGQKTLGATAEFKLGREAQSNDWLKRPYADFCRSSVTGITQILFFKAL